VLECAVAAKADVIVSGDKDLLELEVFEGIIVQRPAQLRVQ
jgi:predicted nucleic acid-binding protein